MICNQMSQYFFVEFLNLLVDGPQAFPPIIDEGIWLVIGIEGSPTGRSHNPWPGKAGPPRFTETIETPKNNLKNNEKFKKNSIENENSK